MLGKHSVVTDNKPSSWYQEGIPHHACMVLLAGGPATILQFFPIWTKTPWLEHHQAGQEQRLQFLGAQHPNSVWLDDDEDSPQEHSRQHQ
jgi:hypothetical protein